MHAPIALLAAALLNATPVDAEAPCRLAEDERAWIDGAFRAWDHVRRQHLRLAETPRPTIVMFDVRCRYEARAEGRLDWVGAPHDGTVRLPNGTTIPPAVTSFTAPGVGDAPPFFAMALPSVWRAANIRSGLGLEVLLEAVLLHEYMHTRQAYFATPYLERLGRRYAIDDINDDGLQARFASDPAYVAAYEHERDLLYAAAAEADDARAAALAEEALRAMRARQGRFTGADAYWKPLDDLFLTMEGVGQWSAYTWLIDPRGRALPPEVALREMRRGDRFWSQAEGLALILAVDRLLPNWQALAFAPEPLLGAELLAAAVEAQAG